MVIVDVDIGIVAVVVSAHIVTVTVIVVHDCWELAVHVGAEPEAGAEGAEEGHGGGAAQFVALRGVGLSGNECE